MAKSQVQTSWLFEPTQQAALENPVVNAQYQQGGLSWHRPTLQGATLAPNCPFPTCWNPSCAACVQVVDTDTGKFKFDDVRTSSGYFLKRGQDEIIKRLERRIAEWTRLPVENGEPFHILRYQVWTDSAHIQPPL